VEWIKEAESYESEAALDTEHWLKHSLFHPFRTKVISFGETKPTRHLGLDLNFVPLESCNPGVGEFIPVPYNHMDICKPESKKSILFRFAYT
jgi:hypothetical protein